MQEYPELKKKLQEVEDKQNRWIGRRLEATDAQDPSTTRTEQVFAAAVPGPALQLEKALEQLTVGPVPGPSGQGGEESIEANETVQKFQQKISALEKSIE